MGPLALALTMMAIGSEQYALQNYFISDGICLQKPMPDVCYRHGVGGEPVSDVPPIKIKSKDVPYFCKEPEMCNVIGGMCPVRYLLKYPDGGTSHIEISSIDDHSAEIIPDCPWGPTMKYTCADKTRMLMTAEDGTKHCIKF